MGVVFPHVSTRGKFDFDSAAVGKERNAHSDTQPRLKQLSQYPNTRLRENDP